MSDALVFALSSLAAFRIWRFLAVDKFPPVAWARDKVEGFVVDRFGAPWADGVTCSHCSGTWVAFAVTAAVWSVRPLPLPALWFAAVAAAVGLMAQYDEG